jgi:hypothetical protein
MLEDFAFRSCWGGLRHLPREIRRELIVYEHLVVKWPGQSFPCQPDEVRFIPRKVHSLLQFVRRNDIGTQTFTLRILEEYIKPIGQLCTRNYVNVSEEDVGILTISSR